MSLTVARVIASDAPPTTEIPLSMLLQGPGPGPATAKWLIRTLAPLLISTMFRNPWLSGTSTAGAEIVLAPEPVPVRVRSFAIDTCST